VIPTHYKYICVVETTTLKMTKLVAENCRCHTATKLHSWPQSAFVSFL